MYVPPSELSLENMSIKHKACKITIQNGRSRLGRAENMHDEFAVAALHHFSLSCHLISNLDRGSKSNLCTSKDHIRIIHRQHCRVISKAESKPTMGQTPLVSSHLRPDAQSNGGRSFAQLDRLADKFS